MRSVSPEIQTVEKSSVENEPLYAVVIHNDNVTPMDFVAEVLKRIFFLGSDRAAEVTLIAHVKGAAYVQTLPCAEAQKRTSQAHQAANAEGYPLRFTLEPENAS